MMGFSPNQRGSRTRSTHETITVTNGSSTITNKRKWFNLMPLFVALVVIAEIAFLSRLDMVENAALVDSWADLFYRSPPDREVFVDGDSLEVGLAATIDRNLDSDRCEDWLEREDSVEYSRDFTMEPIVVTGAEKVRVNFIFLLVLNLLRSNIIWVLN